MDVKIRLWLQSGHVWEFCCDEDDDLLFGLMSALANSSTNLSSDGLIQIEARTGERFFLTRSSLVAVEIVPLRDGLDANRSSSSSLPGSTNPFRLRAKGGVEVAQRVFAVAQTQLDDLRQIDFAIMTVPRIGDYVHQLMTRLRPDLPLRLVVGRPECGYLERYRDNPSIEIVEAPPGEWARFQYCVAHQRAAWNYWRSLALVSREQRRNGLLIFEDDVVPALDWEPRLLSLIDQIEARQSGPYILALYVAVQAQLDAPQDESSYVRIPPESFFGTQAIYYPETQREGLAKYLRAHGVTPFARPMTRWCVNTRKSTM